MRTLGVFLALEANLFATRNVSIRNFVFYRFSHELSLLISFFYYVQLWQSSGTKLKSTRKERKKNNNNNNRKHCLT